MYTNPLVPPPVAVIHPPYARGEKTQSCGAVAPSSFQPSAGKEFPLVIDVRDEVHSPPEGYGLSYKDLHTSYPNFPLFRQNLSASVHGFNTFTSYD